MKNKILKAAFKSSELQDHLVNVICVDDKIDPENLSTETIVKEAKYILSKYIGGEGFCQEEEYQGDRGEEAQIEAMKQVRILRSFLKKYGQTSAL
jgi:hypothetical protein